MRVLVTGGGGYVGRHVARQLLDRGDEVVVLGRGRYPEVEAWGAEGVQVDLAEDDPALAEAMAGCDAVVHAAALPPYFAPEAVFRPVNVDGTRRVIDACRAAGVTRLVYTSTPSVVFDGAPCEGRGEDACPYPDRYDSPYGATKAEAERMVLAAHGPELATVSLRPRLVYGPEEPHMLPKVLARHRAGRLRRIGDGTNRMALTYVDNAAAAHLQALDALGPDAPCGGRAYFVTDPEPVVFWAWIDRFLTGVGATPVRGAVGLGTARALGGVAETLWTWLPLSGEPPMTRFVATQMATSAWYDLSAGRRDLGLHAPVSGDEGLARTIAWFRAHGGA